MTLYRKQGARLSPRRRNAKREKCCLRRQIAEKRREMKGKGEKERYTHLIGRQ